MLISLYIKNYILISETTIVFGPHLNIITGETGAGKSILVGALGLIMGQRAESNTLFDTKSKCIIEATFDLDTDALSHFFQENELDYATNTIIRREITPSGVSRAFVNDTPVTLPLLKILTAQLMDIHSQHDTLAINKASYQLQVVDVFAQFENKLIAYQEDFKNLQNLTKKYEEFIQLQNATLREQDYLQFQYNELVELSLNTDAQLAELEQKVATANNADTIMQHLENAADILDQEQGIMAMLNILHTHIHTITRYNPNYISYKERIHNCIIELKELLQDIIHETEHIHIDPLAAQDCQEKLNLIYKLQKKHNTQSIEQLVIMRLQLEQQLLQIQNFDAEKASLERQLHEIKERLIQQANYLHQVRIATQPVLEEKINIQLASLNLPQALFQVNISNTESLDMYGNSSLQFMFTANPSLPVQELRKVASGGELARLMLAIKTVLSEKMDMPTMLYDEIDTGISGETAIRVGRALEHIAQHKQIIVITHLPQIASRRGQHLVVEKNIKEAVSKTIIRTLAPADRSKVIAQMLGGNDISHTSLQAAIEMLQ